VTPASGVRVVASTTRPVSLPSGAVRSCCDSTASGTVTGTPLPLVIALRSCATAKRQRPGAMSGIS
jgi:hypothetical protein